MKIILSHICDKGARNIPTRTGMLAGCYGPGHHTLDLVLQKSTKFCTDLTFSLKESNKSQVFCG